MIITLSHPNDITPLSLRIAFDNQTTEIELEKDKTELMFYQGSVSVCDV